MTDHPTPPLPEQQQPMPGSSAAMDPQPDYGEASYKGSGKLQGKRAIVTGADSGIGRAVALAFAREGADVLIAYYDEDEDAAETGRLVEDAGRRAVLMPGDIKDPAHCRALVDKAVATFGQQTPLGRPAQPRELATAYVMLADPESSFTTGATVPVTGGRPFL